MILPERVFGRPGANWMASGAASARISMARGRFSIPARKVPSLKKPWSSATGPRTQAGKAASARNAYKGDFHHEANARIASARSGILAVFGRKRWPKGSQ